MLCTFAVPFIINNLIFQCHHARGKSPYACMAQLIKSRSVELSLTIRVLGLTASPAMSKKQSTQAAIAQLESVTNCRLAMMIIMIIMKLMMLVMIMVIKIMF